MAALAAFNWHEPSPRGDGPERLDMEFSDEHSAPHTRGWSADAGRTGRRGPLGPPTRGDGPKLDKPSYGSASSAERAGMRKVLAGVHAVWMPGCGKGTLQVVRGPAKLGDGDRPARFLSEDHRRQRPPRPSGFPAASERSADGWGRAPRAGTPVDPGLSAAVRRRGHLNDRIKSANRFGLLRRFCSPSTRSTTSPMRGVVRGVLLARGDFLGCFGGFEEVGDEVLRDGFVVESGRSYGCG